MLIPNKTTVRSVNRIRGRVKLKKSKKSEKKLDCPDSTHTTPYPFFINHVKKNHTNMKKHKKNPSWGLIHPPTSEVIF